MQNSQSMNSQSQQQQQQQTGDNRTYTPHESIDSSMYTSDPDSQLESQENILCTDSNCEQNYDHQNYENQHSNGMTFILCVFISETRQIFSFIPPSPQLQTHPF